MCKVVLGNLLAGPITNDGKGMVDGLPWMIDNIKNKRCIKKGLI